MNKGSQCLKIFGSEESIMEFDNSSSVVNTNLPEVLAQSPPNMDSVTLEIKHWEERLRNFNINTPPVVYRHQLLERSQSSTSFEYNKKMDCSMTNKLWEQQGIVQVMQLSRTKENMSLADTLKKRRSSSADGRFSHDCIRREVYGRLTMQNIKMPSTSTGFGQMLVPGVKIQINGEGVEI